MELLIIGLIIGLVIGVVITYKLLEAKFKYQLKECRLILEKQIRQDSLMRSRSVIKGRIAEQVAPYLPGFNYNPSDARFIGNPIDYIIFDGYTKAKDDGEDKEINIILMDVKKGSKARLTKVENKIKEAVEKKRIKWETLKIE